VTRHLRDALGVSSALYGALAAVLSQTPSRGTIVRLRAKLADILRAQDAWDAPEVWDRARDVVGALKGVPAGKLAADYAALFLGGSERSVCPSESCYLDGGLYGASTLAVMGAYAAKGFVKDPAFGEPDDHIAVELLFRCACGMDLTAKIASDGPDARSSVEEARACLDFVSGHLLKWTPLLAERVEKTGQTPFYRALLALTRDLVVADARLLAALTRTP
jgi:TorA maturation chaperone TorD